MNTNLDQLYLWMQNKEDEHLEFKEAKNTFEFDELAKYCSALANEGGGKIILGITDKMPRSIVGSRAFENLERTKSGLTEKLFLRIEACEIAHPQGRVIVFTIPSHPVGRPINFKGAYWMRAGASLTTMTPDMLKRILNEETLDYSATICRDADILDLDANALKSFKELWQRKSRQSTLSELSNEQLLIDSELIQDGYLTYAALILFGTAKSLGKHMAQSEVVFEYRSSEASISYQQRKEYRQGFFLIYDDLWNLVNLRNDIQHFQDGLFIWDISTFNEAVVREGILNAICHRDYSLPGSIFVKQYPQKLEIVSPGGFPLGISAKNILWKQSPRNRRLAEAFFKCGLVERSGQGANLMFEKCIKESKSVPSFQGSDDYQVSLTLKGEVMDTNFLKYLEQVNREKDIFLNTHDLLALDLIHNEQPIIEEVKESVHKLVEHGVIERVGRGRGTHYILCRRFYGFLGKKGTYTRKRGLDKETNKALLLKHISDNRQEGSRLEELKQVLPFLTRNQIQSLLKELKADGKIKNLGRTNSSMWFTNEKI